MNDRPSRRRLRFSLRTLFVVVTIGGVWLGYSLNWIRERHRELRWISRHGGAYLDGIPKSCYTPKGSPVELVDNPPPWAIRILGERGVWVVYIEPPSTHDVEFAQHVKSIKRLFPESRVDVLDTPGGYRGIVPATH